jgi:chitodextrinase
MSSNEPVRPAEGRRRASRFGAAVVGVGVLAACTGDNLFTGLGFAIDLGPQVTITAPQANITIAVGDSVQVTATISSTQGVSQVNFAGLLDGGGAAFTPVSVTLPNPPDTTISRFLRRATATAGSARIIVEATDILGGTGADTISVALGG